MERYTKVTLQEVNVTGKGFWSNQIMNMCTSAKILTINYTATVQNIQKKSTTLCGLETSTKTIFKDMQKPYTQVVLYWKENLNLVRLKDKLS